MDRKLRKFAALLAVLCLTLTGCNLIGVDPLMQIAEDRAAVSDVYETVLAEYDGGTVTVADIIYDFNYQWSYYYQLYAMAGMELDEETVAMLRDSCVDAAVQRAAQGVEAERRGLALTEEEIAAAEQTARQLYDESYASLLSQATDADEDVRAARVEYELYASGQDYETILAYYTAEALNSKLREQEDAGITDPGEESIEQAYDQRVESDEANYADSPASFESAMTSGTLVTWMPEGYRTVKHILVIPDESVLTPYQEAKSELDSMQTELDSLNEQLLAATDDDPAEGEEAADPEALETQIAAQEAAIAAAEEELSSLCRRLLCRCAGHARRDTGASGRRRGLPDPHRRIRRGSGHAERADRHGGLLRFGGLHHLGHGLPRRGHAAEQRRRCLRAGIEHERRTHHPLRKRRHPWPCAA